MSRIEQLIGEIEEYIDSCKYQPLSNSKILVNKEEMEELLVELRLRVPDEIKKYQKIISQQDAILADAKNQAESMIQDAKQQTEEMVSENEIMQQAYTKANELVQQAQAQAAAAAKSSGSGSSGGSKGSAKQQDTEKYTSSTAMRLASASSASTQGQLMALDAMYEAGNITKKQYSDLMYALKNPGK